MECNNLVYLSIGSNLGHREKNISESLIYLKNYGEIISISKYFETDPVGFESANKFMNIAVKYMTALSPMELLKKLKETEISMGRLKKNVFTDRIIDLDIVFFNDFKICSDQLTIPHSKYRNRNFVLEPILELSNIQDPVTFINIEQLLR